MNKKYSTVSKIVLKWGLKMRGKVDTHSKNNQNDPKIVKYTQKQRLSMNFSLSGGFCLQNIFLPSSMISPVICDDDQIVQVGYFIRRWILIRPKPVCVTRTVPAHVTVLHISFLRALYVFLAAPHVVCRAGHTLPLVTLDIGIGLKWGYTHWHTHSTITGIIPGVAIMGFAPFLFCNICRDSHAFWTCLDFGGVRGWIAGFWEKRKTHLNVCERGSGKV